jgi:hypothetical protein
MPIRPVVESICSCDIYSCMKIGLERYALGFQETVQSMSLQARPLRDCGTNDGTEYFRRQATNPPARASLQALAPCTSCYDEV